jgi:hypothetical protein
VRRFGVRKQCGRVHLDSILLRGAGMLVILRRCVKDDKERVGRQTK